MTIDQIIDAIWELPFYKVAWIAIVDDLILFVKLWPLWVSMVLLFGLGVYLTSKIRVN